MAKTFEEWYKENEYLDDLVYDPDYFDGVFSYAEFEKALKMAWDASRQNMTTRDI